MVTMLVHVHVKTVVCFLINEILALLHAFLSPKASRV